jgi:hypothetical protein
MPSVFYTVGVKARPGRLGDTVARLQAIKQEALGAGALQVRILNSIAGPTAPSITFAVEFESFAAYEAGVGKVQGSAAFQAVATDTDPPSDIIGQAISVEVE